MISLAPDLADLLEEGGTVVVPSRQRAHAVRLAYAAAQMGAGRRVWASPDVLPLEGWLKREVERLATAGGRPLPRLLSRAEEWLLWRECAAEASKGLELLSRGAVGDALQNASALAAEWGIDLTRAHLMVGSEAQLLFDTEQAVAKRCNTLGASRLQYFSAERPASSGKSRVVFQGFATPSPQLMSLGAESYRSADVGKQQCAVPSAVLASDEVDELERIAAWCKERLGAQSDARILVMLTGNPGARERLAMLIRQAIDPGAWLAGAGANSGAESSAALGSDVLGLAVIEGGAPFADAPVIAHALESLECAAAERVEFTALSEWLRAPFWETPSAPERARIDLWLRESRQAVDGQPDYLSMLERAPGTLLVPARELAGRLRAAADILRAGRISPREWSERFRAALQAMGWPGSGRRASRDQQTVLRFQELLDEFGQLSTTARAMSQHEAIRVFGELAAATAFRPADDDAVITISPRLVDPVVHYDAIWVAGLSAEVFPLPVQPDPFVPLPLQKAAGIPASTAAGRLQEARALLASWRRATQELVLSAPRRLQDLELLPSPLLAPWLSPESSLKGSILEGSSLPWLPLRLHRANQLESCSDALGSAWPIHTPLPVGTRALELQNTCPFRAYAELRLGSAELRAPESGVPADVRGRLMHQALENLWRQVMDSSSLQATTEPQLQRLIEQSVDEAAALVLGPSATRAETRTALVTRECERTVRLIQKLCELERTRAPFRVAAIEKEMHVTLAGARVAMRIDRLDRLESGGCAILDYKTGRAATADWYVERPSHPQLLAYLAAVGSDAVAMATVSLTARAVRFDGVGLSSQLLPKLKAVQGTSTDFCSVWQVRVNEWRECVERLADRFVRGSADVDPKPGACDYCDVASICRISDRGVFAIAEIRGDLPVLPED